MIARRVPIHGWLRTGVALLVLFALAACGDGSPGVPSGPAPAPSDTVRLAVAVLERGADGIPPPPRAPERHAAKADDPDTGPSIETEAAAVANRSASAEFHDFDERVRRFLVAPLVCDAVQFSCSIQSSATESFIEHGLDDPDPEVRLRALVVLVAVRAPRSVPEQWAALEGLRRGPRGVDFEGVTTRIVALFAPTALDAVLAAPPPGDRFSTSPAYQWAVRAAGVTRHRKALERLTVLSSSESLHTSLAAERSLEDFDGPEGDAALARCVNGWQYDAFERAARALLRRDPELLRSTLLASSPPDGQAHWKGVFLARLDDRRGVPILCATVPSLQLIDGEVFDSIERLAGKEDLAAVEALPARVRATQQERATEVVAAVRARLARAR